MSITAKLLRVYQADRQIRGLKGRVQAAERFLKQREKALADLDAKRDSLSGQARHLKAAAHNDETEIAGIEERIDKLREQLNAATTNKQYTALLTEVNTFKADKAAAEERALETMTRMEEITASLEALQDERAEMVKLRDLARAERDARMAEIQERLTELEAERAVAAEDLPPDVLAEYESEVEFRDEDVMASIQEMDRKRLEYCCGACQVLLPVDVVSSAINGGSINRCPSCRAFLYIEQATRDAAVPTKR
ncbi:MAG: hypothetical protein D6693_02915 [Planctomycetota bacterium]|nr:MAG: hypothetical protein D6693_02915 [Planctomycetota bacterium]